MLKKIIKSILILIIILSCILSSFFSVLFFWNQENIELTQLNIKKQEVLNILNHKGKLDRERLLAYLLKNNININKSIIESNDNDLIKISFVYNGKIIDWTYKLT